MLIQTLESCVKDNQQPNCSVETLSTATGLITDAVVEGLKNELKAGQGFPVVWLKHIDSLLGLPGGLHREVITVLVADLDWFYSVDSKWSKKQLLNKLDAYLLLHEWTHYCHLLSQILMTNCTHLFRAAKRAL